MWCCGDTSGEWDAHGRVSKLEAVDSSTAAPPLKGIPCLDDGPEKFGPPKPIQFLVSIVKDETASVGLVLDVLDGRHVLVSDVKEGPVLSHNAKALPSERIGVGDFIVQVNGVEGSSMRLISAFRGASRLDLVVRRPWEFGVTVNIGNVLLGLELGRRVGQRSLLIMQVKDGAIHKWNDDNPDLPVKSNDRIIAVDGHDGTGGDLSARIKKHDASPMTLLISRPAPLDAF